MGRLFVLRSTVKSESRIVRAQRMVALQTVRRHYSTMHPEEASCIGIAVPPGCIRNYQWGRGVREQHRPVKFQHQGVLNDGVLDSINLRTVKNSAGENVKVLIAVIRCADSVLLGVPAVFVWCKAQLIHGGGNLGAYYCSSTPMPKVAAPAHQNDASSDGDDIPQHVFDCMPIDDWGNWATKDVTAIKKKNRFERRLKNDSSNDDIPQHMFDCMPIDD